MDIADFPKLNSFLNGKTGMSNKIGPSKTITRNEADLLCDSIASIQTIKASYKRLGVPLLHFTDSSVLSIAPVVIRGEYANPEAFYRLALRDNFLEFPKDGRTVIHELINIVSNSVALPENRVKYLAIRKIAKSIHERFPTLPRNYRVLHVSDHCQFYVISQRFLFITYGDTGIPRNPKGHIDLFGFDLQGIIENFVNGRELHNVGFKLPTMLSFKNVPATDRSSGGAFLVERLTKPTYHSWVEVRGREEWVSDVLALDFDTIAQNYVNNPKTVLNDSNWNEIKKMIKLTGDNKSVKHQTFKSRAA